MDDPQHDALIEELRKLRRETSSVKVAAWTGVTLLAITLVAVMIDVPWLMGNFLGVILIVLFVRLLLPWLGKWFYRGAKEVLAQKNTLQPRTHE